MIYFSLWVLTITTLGMPFLWIWAIIRRKPYRHKLGVTGIVLIVLGPILSQCNYLLLTEPLVDAAHDGNLTAVNRLLSLGADVNGVGDDGRGTALFAAVSEDHPRIVQTLLQHGADVNKTGNYFSRDTQAPLPAAAGHTEIIAMLKNAGAKE